MAANLLTGEPCEPLGQCNEGSHACEPCSGTLAITPFATQKRCLKSVYGALTVRLDNARNSGGVLPSASRRYSCLYFSFTFTSQITRDTTSRIIAHRDTYLIVAGGLAMALLSTGIPPLRYTCSQLVHMRPTLWNAFNDIGPTRHLSVTVGRQWANQKARVTPMVKTTSKTVAPASLPPQAYRSFADTLALRPSPVLLYQSPSHAVYVTGCWLLGGFCMTWATFNFYSQYLDPIKGTPEWIPVLMGGVCVAMVCAGTWAILGVRIQMLRTCSVYMLMFSVDLPYHSQHYCHTVFHWPQIAHASSPN